MKNTTFIDLYEEQEILGTGTYGIVYRAKHRGTGTRVAIKHIKNIEQGEGLPTTALREISILNKLNHQNIVRLLDVSLEVGDGCALQARLVFEQAEKDLAKYLNLSQPLPQSTIKMLMRQLMECMEFMHSQGYLHRDIKPQNILVFNDGNVLKLADFGLCRRKIAAGPLTLEVGSLWYRAPEIMLGISEYNSAVDMWAIGCLLYELYEGRALFKNACEIGCLFKIFEWTGSPTPQSWPDLFQKATRFSKQFPKFKTPTTRVFKRLPPVAQDLLEKLLQLNYELRPNARQALSHPYFME